MWGKRRQDQIQDQISPGQAEFDPGATQGAALWAFVSPEVDRRLIENIAAPIRLKMEEWKSGDIPWLVEAAGEPRVIEEMLKRLVHGPWAGRKVKMRARTKDGEFKVGLITMAKTETPSAN